MIHLPARHPGATRLYLIRHAAAALEAGVCCGSLDVGLSQRGREQARQLGAALADAGLAAVYTSPRERARRTTAEVASRNGLVPRNLPDLAEIDFGELEGRTFKEIAAAYPETYATWMSRPDKAAFPGGERFADFASRVRGAARQILAAHPGEQVAIVSHGGPLRLLLADALAMPAAALFRLDQAHASLSIIDWMADTPLVRLLNAPAHVEPD